jgi:hypothetical protein
MKRILTLIVILSLCLHTSGQTKKITDPIIMGASDYIKMNLKDPSSHILIGGSKDPIMLTDVVGEHMRKIRLSQRMLQYNKKKCDSLLPHCINIIMSDHKLYNEYSDPIKFTKALEELKKHETNELEKKLDVNNRYSTAYYLEYAKLKADIESIKIYTLKVDEIKKNLENIEEYIKTTYEYRESKEIQNYIRFMEYDSIISDTTRMIAFMDKNKYRYNSPFSDFTFINRMISEYTQKILEEKKQIDDLIGISNNPISGIPERLSGELIKLSNYINEPNQKNIIFGYRIFINYSATNTYGGRIEDSEFVYFRNNLYSYKLKII